MILYEVRTYDFYRSLDGADVFRLSDNGTDPGLTTLLTLADGTVMDPPKALKLSPARLRSAQKDISRKFEMRKKCQAAEVARCQAHGLPAPSSLRESPYFYTVSSYCFLRSFDLLTWCRCIMKLLSVSTALHLSKKLGNKILSCGCVH